MIIRFGILGCGYIGTRHAKHISEHPEAQLVAAFDTNAGAMKSLLSHYENVLCTKSAEELFARPDIDIISVCTPNGNHFTSAMNALNAGKHVLIEKPMALHSSDCQQLIDKAKEKNLQIFVVKQNRFNAPVQALKQVLDEGKLGKIYMVVVNCFWNRSKDYYKNSSWKGRKDMDGGTLFTQFSHFIDIFYYLFGDIENICGIVTNASHKGLTEFEDSGTFSFNFLNGAIGSLNFTTSSFEKNMEGSIIVFAENGTIKLGGQYLNKLDYQRTKGFDITNLPEAGPANDYGYYQGSMSNHDKVISNVVETLNGRGEIMTSAADGKKVVDIIERLYSSARVN